MPCPVSLLQLYTIKIRPLFLWAFFSELISECASGIVFLSKIVTWA